MRIGLYTLASVSPDLAARHYKSIRFIRLRFITAVKCKEQRACHTEMAIGTNIKYQITDTTQTHYDTWYSSGKKSCCIIR